MNKWSQIGLLLMRTQTHRSLPFGNAMQRVSSDRKCGPVETAIRDKLNLRFKFKNYPSIRPITTQVINESEILRPEIVKRVAVMGGGSWGSAITNIIAYNVLKNPHLFHGEVILYLRDDRLRLAIEKTRHNIRYLSAIKLPPNVKPVSSLSEAVSHSDIILFVIPHEFVRDLCAAILDCHLSRTPIAVSLVKGLHVTNGGNVERTSEIISRMLEMKVAVLSGANIAIEVARNEYSEATLSFSERNSSCVQILCALFESENFKISVCYDTPTVEMLGALKNIVACGVGLVDGLGCGINTKSATISCGLRESIKFIQIFHPDFQFSTLLESCGVADTIATAFAGRNRKVMEEFVRTKKPIDMLEKQLLNGQELQGPHTARVVNQILIKRQIEHQFPFFVAVNQICNGNMDPKDLIKAIKLSN